MHATQAAPLWPAAVKRFTYFRHTAPYTHHLSPSPTPGEPKAMAGVDVLASAFSGANAAYLADLYARWTENPASVDPSYTELCAGLHDEARAIQTDASGASWAPRHFGLGETQAAAAAQITDRRNVA